MRTLFVKKICFLVFFMVTGCSVSDKPDNQNGLAALQAYPNTFSLGDDILLKFPENHPGNIAIRTPSNIWFSIYSEKDNIFIIPTEKYTTAKELKLDTGILEGLTWVNGIRVKKPVFNKQGKYLIYMADNLETEPDNTFYFMTEVILVKD